MKLATSLWEETKMIETSNLVLSPSACPCGLCLLPSQVMPPVAKTLYLLNDPCAHPLPYLVDREFECHNQESETSCGLSLCCGDAHETMKLAAPTRYTLQIHNLQDGYNVAQTVTRTVNVRVSGASVPSSSGLADQEMVGEIILVVYHTDAILTINDKL